MYGFWLHLYNTELLSNVTLFSLNCKGSWRVLLCKTGESVVNEWPFKRLFRSLHSWVLVVMRDRLKVGEGRIRIVRVTLRVLCAPLSPLPLSLSLSLVILRKLSLSASPVTPLWGGRGTGMCQAPRGAPPAPAQQTADNVPPGAGVKGGGSPMRTGWRALHPTRTCPILHYWPPCSLAVIIQHP